MPVFTFAQSWEVAAAVEEVAARLVDLERYPTWWPEVRAVARIDAETAWVVCRSVLPYRLDLIARAVSREAPVLEVALDGDLQGFARFTLRPVAGGTRVEFDERVRVRGVLAVAAYPLHPLLVWNHRQMMRSAVRGLGALGRCERGSPEP